MSWTQAISSSKSCAIRCATCRAAITRTTTKKPTNGLPLRYALPPSTRTFTTCPGWRADRNDPAIEDPEFAFLEDSKPPPSTSKAISTPSTRPYEPTPSPPPTTPSPSQNSPLPWYLQNRTTPTPQRPVALPPLPANPPPLLQTLLEYLSTTAGLDNLTLLDLRHLDPPPALGPKLLMILATARSEKHLHVTADRFCRYLRREHNLRANAAGLLGRNELKIKLRRKAKRMKILANVNGGAPVEEQGNVDDGIRTGWICCTVGKIEAHKLDRDEVGGGKDSFVGFRDVRPGVNVVVQMFTEEKRAEIDLETLWGGILRSHERKDRHAEESLEDVNDEDMEEGEESDESHTQPRLQRHLKETQNVSERLERPSAPAPSPIYQFNKSRPTAGDAFPPASDPRVLEQVRRRHTTQLVKDAN